LKGENNLRLSGRGGKGASQLGEGITLGQFVGCPISRLLGRWAASERLHVAAAGAGSVAEAALAAAAAASKSATAPDSESVFPS